MSIAVSRRLRGGAIGGTLGNGGGDGEDEDEDEAKNKCINFLYICKNLLRPTITANLNPPP